MRLWINRILFVAMLGLTFTWGYRTGQRYAFPSAPDRSVIRDIPPIGQNLGVYIDYIHGVMCWVRQDAGGISCLPLAQVQGWLPK